jgi:predicted small lipoprotein YifL
MPRLVPLSLVLLLGLGLSACGKRGALEPPPEQTQAREAAKSQAREATRAKAQANMTPDEKAAFDATNTEASQTRTGGRKRVPITAPKRDLFIDGLLD